MDIISSYKTWRQRQVYSVRKPLIQSELSTAKRGPIEYALDRELWAINSVIGTEAEKQRITPGMIHPFTLEWSRARAVDSGFSDLLHLEVETYPLWKILWLRSR